MDVGDFEGHITFSANPDNKNKIIEQGLIENFHFSEIKGWDESSAPFCYILTKIDKNLFDLQYEMNMIEFQLNLEGIEVKRKKIEMAVYDSLNA